ncbi:MAG: Multidrug resistance protein MdtE precursor [Pseudomonadota bacterium]
MLRSPRLGRFPFAYSTLFSMALSLGLSGALVACKKPNSEADQKLETVAISLGNEDVLQVGTSEHGTGPVISGSLQPEIRADLRAEVAAMVIKVHKENGELVRKGDLLVSLDNSVLRDNLNSAEESMRAAAQSLDGAERQYQRIKSLQAQGMVSLQGLEESENKRNSAQSEFVASKARVAAAKQQLDRTEVRAPFQGVVSARKASAGDTAQIGKELIQVIDPSSMRFEGQVSADQMSSLKVGQRVNFRINGVAQSGDQLGSRGTIKRIDGAANPVTRQVSVTVEIAGKDRPPVVGLFAEGVIETSTKSALMVSESSLRREGDKVFAWVLDGNKIVKRHVQLGDRDTRLGEWVVSSGLVAGEKILRNTSSSLKDGQPFTLRADTAAKVGQ